MTYTRVCTNISHRGRGAARVAVEAWNHFASAVESFEEVAAGIRVQAAGAEAVGPLRQRRADFPTEQAAAVVQASERMEDELSPVELDRHPITSDPDRETWLLEERLLASASVDVSLAVEMFQLEWLCSPAADFGEDEEFQAPEPPNPLLSSPLLTPPTAFGLHGGTLGLLLEARPLFAAADPGDAEATPAPGVDPPPFEWPTAHQVFALAGRRGDQVGAMQREMEDAIAQLIAESRETALAFGALPLKAYSADVVESVLGRAGRGLFDLALNWKGWRRKALDLIACGLRKLRRATELRATEPLEKALAKIEATGFSIWLSDVADRRADQLLGKLASAPAARRRIAVTLERGMDLRSWARLVWKPAREEILARHASSQQRARKVASGFGLAIPFFSTVGVGVGPPGVLAASACGLGYSVVGLADRLDASWLGRFGRHQGLPSLVEQHARKVKRPPDDGRRGR